MLYRMLDFFETCPPYDPKCNHDKISLVVVLFFLAVGLLWVAARQATLNRELENL